MTPLNICENFKVTYNKYKALICKNLEIVFMQVNVLKHCFLKSDMRV